MNLGSVPVVPAGDTFLNGTSDPGARPGAQAWSRDGRRFRLVKNSAAGAIGAGKLVQAQTPVAAFSGMVPTADVAVGSKTIRVTAGAAAAPANTYAGGLVYVSAGPLVGALALGVKSHEVIVSGQPFTIVLEPDDLVAAAITAATDRISLIANPYLDVIVAPASGATNANAVGLTVGTGLLAGTWGYVQVQGLAIAVADGAIAIGQAVSPSVAAAGSLVINSTTLPIVGQAVTAGAAGGGFAVQLNLP